jgi:hypothetical protein
MFFTTEFIEDTEESSITVIPGNDPESSCYKGDAFHHGVVEHHAEGVTGFGKGGNL